jgi:macrodomain Ter protein organizer (MatP/YcbG family)
MDDDTSSEHNRFKVLQGKKNEKVQVEKMDDEKLSIMFQQMKNAASERKERFESLLELMATRKKPIDPDQLSESDYLELSIALMYGVYNEESWIASLSRSISEFP